MINKIKVSVPAKIHLLGEHTVVYGKPAILAAISLTCDFVVSTRPDSKIVISSDNYFKEIITSCSDVINRTKKFRTLWQNFNKNNDIYILKSIIKTPEDYVKACIGETLLYLNVQKVSGFNLLINSRIPVGSGLGSSAVIGAGITGALTKYLKKNFKKDIINDITFNCEKFRHGFPSGSDSATIIFGGLVWFRKELPDLRIIKSLSFTLTDKLSSSFLLIDTGKPVESTGEMVSSVRSLYNNDPTGIQKILDSQEKLVKNLYLSFKKADFDSTKDIIKQGEKNLEKLGVVSPVVGKLIRDIESDGGAAKICGGGGKTRGTGIVLALHKDKNNLIKIAEKYKYKYFNTKLGVTGIRFQS